MARSLENEVVGTVLEVTTTARLCKIAAERAGRDRRGGVVGYSLGHAFERDDGQMLGLECDGQFEPQTRLPLDQRLRLGAG